MGMMIRRHRLEREQIYSAPTLKADDKKVEVKAEEEKPKRKPKKVD